jgi:phosphoribosylaminoimidazolecarboxamide formyltransferase/IMP cyclohydrolase
MPDLVPIKRALISVSDKADLGPFARALSSMGVSIISTGGTARAIAELGIDVTPIETVTGFPEMMDGRVKTLHPNVHGALLALRDKPEHARAMTDHGIEPIDLVCVNLYPFERTVSDPAVTQREAIEQIDIGGPSMLRSASKNFEYVTVLTSPRQYDRVISEMSANEGATTRTLRAELAAVAFSRTAEYDAAIATFLGRRGAPAIPEILSPRFVKAQHLRYGENPHQDAALYRDPTSTGPTIVNSQQLHGKALSYNNINDAAAALELVKDLRRLDSEKIGAAVIKHTNACGACVAGSCADAVLGAMAGDPLAAFGGILAVNREFDADAAVRLCKLESFLEVIVAPSFAPEALEMLMGKSANVRLLAVGDKRPSPAAKIDMRSIPGGMLVQGRDTLVASPEKWEHAAGPAPTPETLQAAGPVWLVAKHLKSNAVCIGGVSGSDVALFGAGAGLMDRVSACRQAVEKAGDRAKGAIAASDAFFPFPDGPELLIDAGVRAIVHPGGSRRDDETLALCEARGVTCLVTGERHFRH